MTATEAVAPETVPETLPGDAAVPENLDVEQEAANAAVHCGCPPSHLRLRRIMLSIVAGLLLLLALLGGYVFWLEMRA